MRVKQIVALARKADQEPTLEQKVRDFIAHATQDLRDGIQIAELAQLLAHFVALAVAAAEQLPHVSGEEKKRIVLASVEQLYDCLAPLIPLPWFLAPLRPLLRAPLRALVLAAAEGLLEAAVSRLKQEAA